MAHGQILVSLRRRQEENEFQPATRTLLEMAVRIDLRGLAEIDFGNLIRNRILASYIYGFML